MTLAELELAVHQATGIQHVTPKAVGEFLCGNQSWLAEKPFSVEFLQNVAYNSPAKSFYCVLYLQMRYSIEHSNSY
jgi:hypothetical protein